MQKVEKREEVVVNGKPVYRMTGCNVSVGSKECGKGYPEYWMQNILKGYIKLGKILDPGRWPIEPVHPNTPNSANTHGDISSSWETT